jgi:hypothetical protein
MKLIIQRINTANKPSPLSEGVMNIRINSQPCKGMNPITWHTQARRAPWAATVHEVIKKLGWVLPHPSVVSHMYASANTPWEAWTLSHCTPVKRGKVSSNSLIDDATQFGDSMSRMHQYIQVLVQQGSTDMGLIRHRRGYHHGASNFISYHSPSFPSSILHFPLIALPGLQLCQPFDHLAKPHRTSIDRKGPYHERILTTHLLLIAYTTKHSILSLSFFHRGKQSGLVRVFLVQLGFH